MLLRVESLPLIIHLRPVINLTEDQFLEFCQINRDLCIELTTEGDLVIMPTTYGETGRQNAELTVAVGVWAKQDGSGIVFDSSTGFTLPNGAVRSPDVAWVKRERLAALTPEQREKFLPLCPEFVLELWSLTDSLRIVQAKMQECMANGAQLEWLIDPHKGESTSIGPTARWSFWKIRQKFRVIQCFLDLNSISAKFGSQAYRR